MCQNPTILLKRWEVNLVFTASCDLYACRAIPNWKIKSDHLKKVLIISVLFLDNWDTFWQIGSSKGAKISGLVQGVHKKRNAILKRKGCCPALRNIYLILLAALAKKLFWSILKFEAHLFCLHDLRNVTFRARFFISHRFRRITQHLRPCEECMHNLQFGQQLYYVGIPR